ncbi:MAG: TonB-dependent receptor [Schleiferiaceae bacterium]|nr:TonB-dependent receptor [Schleiferiaceae bacterium]
MKLIPICMVALGLLSGLTRIRAQETIAGKVFEAQSGDPVFMANVVLKERAQGATTDEAGRFSFAVPAQAFPVTLEISLIGYKTITRKLKGPAQGLKFKLTPDQAMLQEVSVVEKRLSEKQKESALTVVALDALAIKETPASDFYAALGHLKGVDVTSASLGFKIINTRGFNSTSPVRSLQLIDGVDNQAPGLNFALGNFLGASELDLVNVNVIAGASTAFYGPGAFNGVVAMKTKNPFDYQGLSASVKVGERALTRTAVRYAEGFSLFSEERDDFAFKLNLSYLTANDWEATNYRPVEESPVGRDNPGRYDAVNRYGDESLASNNDFRSFEDVKSNNSAGLGLFYRPGYREPDLVDYDTRNLKANAGLFYRSKDSIQISYNLNYGGGTTVFQGENRFSLNNIRFWQNVLEVSKPDRFFLRAYSTQEDAGDSYDAVLTAFKMNDATMGDEQTWNQNYASFWNRSPFRFADAFQDSAGFNVRSPSFDSAYYAGPYQNILDQYNGLLGNYHDSLLGITSAGRPLPGSAAFDSLFNDITSRTFQQGGARFFDRSALYHFMGEYQFTLPGDIKSRVGGNFRMYRPRSRGNIFDEVIPSSIETDSVGNVLSQDYRQIALNEYGAYLGLQRKFWGEILKVSTTLRMDKNQNFDFLFSPALSMVYSPDADHTFRASLSRAIRNPTLQDQYLRYDVGRATLLGNLNGYDSLVTIESYDFYRSQSSLQKENLTFFDVDPIKPESVFTLEGGYRGSWFDRLYLDMTYFYSWYRNFIGFQFGLDPTFSAQPGTSDRITRLQAYRVAANARDLVTTQGFNLGLNYYLDDHLVVNGNYSFNQLNQANTVNPIIPAFNTPTHKYNLGLTGRNYNWPKSSDHKFGFGLNYKWVDGFRFEGSPQFSGSIDAYGMLDAQVNYQMPDYHLTFKLGASNLLNNRVTTVYGGPTIGRLAYLTITYDVSPDELNSDLEAAKEGLEKAGSYFYNLLP